jgi:excisionase family DNA binding protein
MDETESRQVLSTTQAGKLLSVSDETIKRYLAAGTLKGFKLPGGYYRVFRDSVDALMDAGSQ